MSQKSASVVLDAFKLSKTFYKNTTKGLFYDLFEKNNFKKTQPSESRQAEATLSDVSFQLKSGEILGVLGKNGAGKSTLLKILAGIIKPQIGRVTAHDPIVPLLDVGIAVHWDLNGFSNFLLEGTAQGWQLKELQEAMPRIIDYSGLGAHLDKPIKHFSSGMLTRLSLSTAFFREKSVFLLDEVFGAGDAQFREKTTETVIQKSKEGSSFVIVAHNTDILKRLCNRAIYLEKGQIKFDGEVEKALAFYFQK
jgi:ABC-type polysaccharide/polyol phosphate transport system ATPase subunit